MKRTTHIEIGQRFRSIGVTGKPTRAYEVQALFRSMALPADELNAFRKIANTRSSPFTPPDFDAACKTIAKLMNSQRRA